MKLRLQKRLGAISKLQNQKESRFISSRTYIHSDVTCTLQQGNGFWKKLLCFSESICRADIWPQTFTHHPLVIFHIMNWSFYMELWFY